MAELPRRVPNPNAKPEAAAEQAEAGLDVKLGELKKTAKQACAWLHLPLPYVCHGPSEQDGTWLLHS